MNGITTAITTLQSQLLTVVVPVAVISVILWFIANALACNMVGVLTFQFGRGGEHFHYDWLNIPGMRPDFHDEIAHKDNGSDATAANGAAYSSVVER